jgi:hypothetical protein
MRKSTLREKRIIIDWLRRSRVFNDNKDEFASLQAVEMAELETSLRLCWAWKKQLSADYDKIFAESNFRDTVRFHYKRNAAGVGEDRKDVDFYEHRLLQSLAEKNGIERDYYGRMSSKFWNEYGKCNVDDRPLKFVPDEKHLDMLKRLNEINEQSRKALNVISSLKSEIKYRKDRERVLRPVVVSV